MFHSTCIDEYCQYRIIFPADSTTVVCRGCGQTHNVKELPDIKPVEGLETKLQSLLTSLSVESQAPERGPENVKVLGASNYHHKLLSHLLTTHGMDEKKARPLNELQRPTLGWSEFGDLCFSIEERHLNLSGYGRDLSGSAQYLKDTLDLILQHNDNKETLVPLHVDGDGHCLVHAVSRALVGRQILWHPLRCHLQIHFKAYLDTYKKLLGEFITESDWQRIISECDPYFNPPDDIVGLRPIHVFGLANLLRRPILLLDSVAGMKTSAADYAAVFLPRLFPPGRCCNKAGRLNPPLCIAWSSSARNHYVPLVQVKERPLPQFPKSLLPKVWGLPQSDLEKYLQFNKNDCVVIGGENCVQADYMLQLTSAMDELFQQKYGVQAQLVSDFYLCCYASKNTGAGLQIKSVVKATTRALENGRLQRCLNCSAVAAQNSNICRFCSGKLRMIRHDGTVAYENGDVTNEPVKNPLNRCPCGFKHWWNGVAYDNPPVEDSRTVKKSWAEAGRRDERQNENEPPKEQGTRLLKLRQYKAAKEALALKRARVERKPPFILFGSAPPPVKRSLQGIPFQAKVTHSVKKLTSPYTPVVLKRSLKRKKLRHISNLANKSQEKLENSMECEADEVLAAPLASVTKGTSEILSTFPSVSSLINQESATAGVLKELGLHCKQQQCSSRITISPRTRLAPDKPGASIHQSSKTNKRKKSKKITALVKKFEANPLKEKADLEKSLEQAKHKRNELESEDQEQMCDVTVGLRADSEHYRILSSSVNSLQQQLQKSNKEIQKSNKEIRKLKNLCKTHSRKIKELEKRNGGSKLPRSQRKYSGLPLVRLRSDRPPDGPARSQHKSYRHRPALKEIKENNSVPPPSPTKTI
ncbi:deubiquitinating protein VCPIP1-like isoform X2 [Macrosteles quadrilineatus]|uniref:deubiquitinating protein VCPIP1-like isoform X2 n=1 Tax=Macrosteles quadrilineatus TaxID=74068 RepID=UPI0023E0B30D|nr:deubiquitinating protein VCPIP1-like isoform X2 [Macrosteles quadrilineatus]